MSLFHRAYLAALAVCLASLSAHAVPAEPDAARPFVLCDAYCAIVDARGKPVSDRVFDRVDDATGQVVIYGHDGKRGALNARGKRILKPVYDDLFVPEGEPFIQGYIKGKNASAPNTDLLFDLDGNPVLTRTDEQVGAWQGHPYYIVQCSGQDKGSRPCGTFFTGKDGRVVARFRYFYPEGASPLAVASPDGKRFGYVGPGLAFRIHAVYTHAEPFQDGYALVSNEEGMGLVDAKGDVRIAPGTFKALFGDEDDLFYVGFVAGDRQCGRYVRRDGTPVELPDGVCPFSSSRSLLHGYDLVRGKDGIGAIDASGAVIIAPRYAGLLPLSGRYLAFARKRGGPYGMMDRRGNVLIQPGYLYLKLGPDGTVVAQRPDRTVVLLDRRGRRLGKHAFRDLEPLSAALLSYTLRRPDGRMEHGFVKPDGTVLPLRGSAARVTEGPGRPARFVVSEYVEPGVLKKGLMDGRGRVIVPLAEHVKSIEYLGDDLWRVRRYKRNSPPVDDVYDAAGRIVAALAPYRDIQPFRGGVTTAREKARGNPVLIDAQGRVLASYAALFPQYTARAREGDGIVMQALDRCRVADPAAEPEERPVESGVDKRICADPALRSLSRQTEKAYYSAQAGPCLPGVFMALRPAYDKALAVCADNACLRRSMLGLRKRLAAVAKTCARARSVVRWSDEPVPKGEQRALTKVIAGHGDNYYAQDADNASSGDQGALSFQNLALGKLPAALVTQNTYAHNEPFWLLAKDGHGKWRIILQDYAGYLRGFDVAGATHNGLPILRIQQHASCCEHDVEYFQYDGHEYRSRRQCTQLYDGDETPVLFCGPVEDKRTGGAGG
jgi:hypothetical protein